MSRILGLDLGTRTCGIAISDALMFTAQGMETFRFNEGGYNAILKHLESYITKYQVKKVVLGLPKHLNGDEGEASQRSYDFKTRLESMYNVEVILWDERWSSLAVNKMLIASDVSRKKRKQVVDKLAAVTILQGYLDSLS